MTACRLAAILPEAVVIRDPRRAKPLQFLRVEPGVARAVATVARIFGPVAVMRGDA